MDSDDCGDWAICDGVYVVEDVAEAARKISEAEDVCDGGSMDFDSGDCDCISECGGVLCADAIDDGEVYGEV